MTHQRHFLVGQPLQLPYLVDDVDFRSLYSKLQPLQEFQFAQNQIQASEISRECYWTEGGMEKLVYRGRWETIRSNRWVMEQCSKLIFLLRIPYLIQAQQNM